MAFFDSSKSVLENISFLSSPIIAMLSFLIFRQIRLSKEQLDLQRGQALETQKQIIITSKRESIKLSVEQIHFFTEKNASRHPSSGRLVTHTFDAEVLFRRTLRQRPERFDC